MTEITEERLSYLEKKIKPVGKKFFFDIDVLFFLHYDDARFSDFFTNRRYLGRAWFLEKYTQITTLHDFEHPSWFQPTIADVLAQIPLQFVNDAAAFEVLVDTIKVDQEQHSVRVQIYKRYNPLDRLANNVGEFLGAILGRNTAFG